MSGSNIRTYDVTQSIYSCKLGHTGLDVRCGGGGGGGNHQAPAVLIEASTIPSCTQPCAVFCFYADWDLLRN